MYMLAIPVVIYLISSKWDVIKPMLPQKLVDFLSRSIAPLLSRPAEVVNLLHGVFLMFVFIYALPLDWLGFYFNTIFFTLSLSVMVVGSLITIVTNWGPPPIKEGWEKCKVYLATVQSTVEFPWLFYAFIFLSAEPMLLILLIPARRSFSATMKFSKTRMAGMPQLEQYKEYFEQFEKKDPELQLMAGVGEIMLGFILVFRCFLSGFSGVFTALLFWQLLRMKYHFPKTKDKQIQAWSVIGDRVNPIIEKVPAVNGIVEKGKEFWKQPM